MSNTVKVMIGAAIGGLIGTLVLGPLGAAAGAAVGVIGAYKVAGA